MSIRRPKYDLRYTKSRRTIGKSGISRARLESLARSAGVMKARTAAVMPVAGYTRLSGFYGRFGPGGEKKFFDTTLGSTALATAGVVLNDSLNLIPQGTTQSTRIGRKCTISKINMRGFMVLASNATASSEVYRIILALDKQANGATAAVTDLLTTADEKSFNNLSNSGRFMVLKDWYGTMNKMADIGTNINSVIKPFVFNKSCSIPVEFSSTMGAITEIRSNNIFLIGVSSSTTLTFSHTTRVRYTDA